MSSLLAFEEALTAIEQAASVRVKTETLPLTKSLGRILANNIVAPINVPPQANSAMDGYAIAYQDWQDGKAFTVSQRIAAGQAPTPLQTGTCARIFTGAILPAGADTIIMQENAQIEAEQVCFHPSPQQSDNVRPSGQDMKQGQTIAFAGQKLSAMQIGLLASLGITQITVFTPLKVGILTTGDELIPAGSSLKSGQIYNSNGPMLAALVSEAGHKVTCSLHAADTPEATEQALQQLIKECDVILSSGGVSVGEEDHVKGVLEKLGTLHLWKIAIKPGKPLVHASLEGIPFLGLPGNPSSTLVTFHWFARLLLSVCAGAQATRPEAYKIKAGFNRHRAIQRDEFLRVTIRQGKAHPHAQQSSGALLAACESQGYLHIRAQELVKEDQEYDFYPFHSF
ncbi:gephyrin-like molybdotransferase Glp [Marinomonas posidonica]|uniref:Molybdopterin molybdenumtransferase n=1 Tax=Marinomonas posidonica (strain CECT 7376 / NCIMB 14433 / IVIA-Po-181) TaxID=491952 RepID=F6CXK7_MARPP|nr:gephyrin-like molybdotransferase Glp [Marinomonas posidonica]AEF55623.1 molybdenum cofactor synthesis domain protein [Marinomonas posidonica IVIA-Po-181]